MSDLEDSYIDIYNKALCKIKENNISEAVSLLEKAYELNSKDTDILNLLGLCYFALCNFKRTLSLWTRSKEINKEEENKANIYLEFFNSKEVSSDKEVYKKALSLIEQKRYKEALEDLKSLSDKDYCWADVDLLIGLILIKKRQYKKAEIYFKKAQEKDCGNVLSKNYIEKLRQNRIYKRRRIWFFSLLIFIIIVFTISLIFLFNKNREDKIEFTKETSSLNNSLMEKEKELAYKEGELKEKEDYIKKLEKKIQDFTYDKDKGEKSDKEGISLLGGALSAYKNSSYKEAINSLKNIEMGDYENYLKNEAVFWQAQCHEKLKEYDLAIEDYKDYINNFKNQCYYDDSLYRISMLLEELGDKKDAKIYAEKLKNQCGDSIFNNSNIERILKE